MCCQVFYIFGVAGIGWSLWWEGLVKSIEQEDPDMAGRLVNPRGQEGSAQQKVPWRALLRNRPVQALAYVHFCNNWQVAQSPCMTEPSFFMGRYSTGVLTDRVRPCVSRRQ